MGNTEPTQRAAKPVAGQGWQDGKLFEVPAIELVAPPKKRRRKSKDEPREFGSWTLDKLTILDQYLKMYRRVAGSGTYIDAFAGEGTARINGADVPGSPIRALDSGSFRTLKFIELDDEVRSALGLRLAGHKWTKRCEVLPGDANQVIKKLLGDDAIERDRPCFAFLDPNSTQLDWATVEALAGYKELVEGTKLCKVELWILFNEQQAIQRLWPRDKSGLPTTAHVLDRVMGGRAAWLDLWNDRCGPQWLVHRYRERLRALGYSHVNMQQIIDPATHRPQYWMLHATDHKAAVSFMRWAKRTSSIVYRTEAFPGLDVNDN